MRYLLDTNVCIDYLGGRYPAVVRRLTEAAPEDLAVSAVSVAELRYGADKSERPRANHARLNALFRELRCVDFDRSAAAAYGRLRSGLERRGKPIGPNDMLIAAQALSRGLVLVTDNVREFRRVPRLKLVNWRV